MRRRRLLQLTAGMPAAWCAPPLLAQRSPRTMRLGILRPNRAAPGDLQAVGVPAALQRLGWVESRNLVIETRHADGRFERLDPLAAELVAANCDAVVAVGRSASQAMARATSRIPIVMFGNFDPLAGGLVSSLARPGGNLTGVMISPDGTLAVKRVELLRQAAPDLGRVGLLAPEDPTFAAQTDETRAAATAIGLSLGIATVRAAGYAAAFEELAATGAQAVVVGAHTTFVADRRAIIDLTLQRRWPSNWEWAEQVRDGGLLAYGTSLAALYDRIAGYLDRLFKGAKAADLPVERPAAFALTVNLRTARAIGLRIPIDLLARAEQVIE